jgi:hypothetical protein
MCQPTHHAHVPECRLLTQSGHWVNVAPERLFRALATRRDLRGGRYPAPSAQGVHFFCRHIGVLLFSAESRAGDVMSDR